MPTLTDAESAGAIREHHAELQAALREKEDELLIPALVADPNVSLDELRSGPQELVG